MKFLQIALLSVLFSVSFFACSDEKSNVNNPDTALIEKIWDYSEDNPEGFTINICNWTVPKEGVSVAYAATQNSFGKESLSKVVEHSQAHECYLGGWLNPDDQRYYFDSVRLFPEDSLDSAIKFGKDNKQYSIYIISKGATIWLNK